MSGPKRLFHFHLLKLTLNGRGSNSIRYSDVKLVTATKCNKNSSDSHNNNFHNNSDSCTISSAQIKVV